MGVIIICGNKKTKTILNKNKQGKLVLGNFIFLQIMYIHWCWMYVIYRKEAITNFAFLLFCSAFTIYKPPTNSQCTIQQQEPLKHDKYISLFSENCWLHTWWQWPIYLVLHNHHNSKVNPITYPFVQCFWHQRIICSQVITTHISFSFCLNCQIYIYILFYNAHF